MIPILKEMGYRKRRLTWFRQLNETTIVFNIQKSQYSCDTWYYQFGIGINSLAGEKINSISQCDIICRFDQSVSGKLLQADDLKWILLRWSEKYGSIDQLRSTAREGTLPQITTIRAKKYLLAQNK